MSEKPIRVLLLVSNLRSANGVASFAMNYFRCMDHNSVRIDFALFLNSENLYEEEIKAAGGHIFLLPPLKNYFAHIRACREIIKNGNYDIVHGNLLLLSIPIFSEAKKQCVPVRILHSHNSKLGETKMKEKRNAFFLPLLMNKVNAFAACSDLAAKAMFGDAEYEFIPNLIDADKYCFNAETRESVRKKMSAGGKFVIATVGRLAPQKNPFFAMNVFDLVAEKLPNAEYWWIGSGPFDNDASDYAAKLKHGGRVKLFGSRDDVNELYQAIDLFFLPSIFEGLPVTGVEAQAMGLPCIVSDSVTREMVYTDLVKYISLDAPEEEWVNAICEQAEKDDSRAGRREDLLNSRFSSEHAGEFLEDYYRQLLKNKK